MNQEALEEGRELNLDFNRIRTRSGVGVVPVVVQQFDTKEVLLIGFANDVALQKTLEEKKAVLWSFTRDSLWRKGETSGDFLELKEVLVNCEQNSLLYVVNMLGQGVCHTKPDGKSRRTCYYRRLEDGSTVAPLVAP